MNHYIVFSELSSNPFGKLQENYRTRLVLHFKVHALTLPVDPDIYEGNFIALFLLDTCLISLQWQPIPYKTQQKHWNQMI